MITRVILPGGWLEVPYRVPTFNQPCQVVTAAYGGRPAHYLDTVCQIRGVTHLKSPNGYDGGYYAQLLSLICLPAGTAVYAVEPDGVSSRIFVSYDDPSTEYLVLSVQDVAQGFSNEYRVVLAQRLSALHGQ